MRYDQSWIYLAGALALAIQAVMIATLWIQRSRRRESEARNEAILRAAPDLMFLQTKEGVYLDYYAPERERLLVPPEQFIGRNMRDVLPPALYERLAPLFERVWESDTPVIAEYTIEIGGAVRQYEARLVRCGDHRVLSIVRDITERTQTEAARRDSDEALRHAQTDLDRMSRLVTLGEFAASIAHEVSQPLTAIVLNARTCLRLLDDPVVNLPELRATLTDVIDAGKRADGIIRRNRELFRHHVVEKHPINVNDVVEEAAVLADMRMRAHRVKLETRLANQVPPVLADRLELCQLMLNLFANAIDAMNGQSLTARNITVTTEATEAREVQVSVRDAGVGLSSVDAERMFTTGYTTKPKGTGVGLSICRAIVEAHGGRIWAVPNDGPGVTFAFTLPLADTVSLRQQPDGEGGHVRL